MANNNHKLAIAGGEPIRQLPFGRWPRLTTETNKEILSVLDSGRWLGWGVESEVTKFENEYAIYHGLRHCVAVCNGTCALYVALSALGVKEGDEVIVPSLSFVATATSITWLRGIPVFVDISERSLCASPSSIETAIGPKTKAIIVVHHGGDPCDMESVMKIALKYRIPVIEDCAQAHGAELLNKKVGTWGTLAVFSFAATKNLTGGEGGAILTEDSSLYERMCELRNHGRTKSANNWHPKLGWNFRMPGICAALLRPQLTELDAMLYIKNKAAGILDRTIQEANISWVFPLKVHETVTLRGLFAYTLKYLPEAFKGLFVNTIAKALNAEGIPLSTRLMIPLYRNPIYADRLSPDYSPCQITACPNAESAVQRTLLLGQLTGSAILLSENDVDLLDVSLALKKIDKNIGELLKYQENQPNIFY